MKKILNLTLAGVLGALCSTVAWAAYATFTASGTTSATVVIPHIATAQARIVSVVASSDLVGSTLSFYTGGASTTIAAPGTNAAATTIPVSSTNGMSTNVWLSIEGTTNVMRQVAYATANGTVVITAALGSVVSSGNEVEIMSNDVTLGIGSNTYKTFSSEALYVAKPGRAAAIVVTGTSACSIDAATTKYDPNSQ